MRFRLSQAKEQRAYRHENFAEIIRIPGVRQLVAAFSTCAGIS